MGWANRPFLEDVLKLLETRLPKLRKYDLVRSTRDNKFHDLVIGSKGMKLYAEKIGFRHSRKSNNLKLFLRMKIRKGASARPWETKKKILRGLWLGKGGKTTRELMYSIGVNPDVIRMHLVGYKSKNKRIPGLEELGQVKKKNVKGERKWSITSKGRQFLRSADNVLESRLSSDF